VEGPREADVNPPVPVLTRTALSKATGSAVVAAHVRNRTVVDFITADHAHGMLLTRTMDVVMETRPAHWALCAALFHRAIPSGAYRIKAVLDPGMLTTDVLRNTRAVLREQALESGWGPVGGIHARWIALGRDAAVVLEVAVSDHLGRSYPDEPSRATR
jgi:hypothetical protein